MKKDSDVDSRSPQDRTEVGRPDAARNQQKQGPEQHGKDGQQGNCFSCSCFLDEQIRSFVWDH